MGTNEFRYVLEPVFFYLTGLIREDMGSFSQQGKYSVQKCNLQPRAVPRVTEAQLYRLSALRHTNTSTFCNCN